MPFLRFSRDKRGIESFSLVHTTTNRRGKVRPRVLYFFRTPPDIKVGREPFDPELRRALERQHPDITFDWRAIAETPIPSADADKWRERRRAERAAKHAARAEESAEAAEAAEAEPDTEPGEPAEPAEPGAELAAGAAAKPDAPADGAMVAETGESRSDPGKRRRRRRRSGGRGGNPPGAGRPASTPPSGGGEPSGD